MNVFLDTSFILCVLLEQEDMEPLPWPAWQNVYCSQLAKIEVYRTLDRMRLESRLDDEERMYLTRHFQLFWSGCHQVELDETILSRSAAAFPTVIGTLDALHLSTALMLQEHVHPKLVLLTKDRQQLRAAIASGLSVQD
jgi:predicted nucleic acid-binding protein